MGISGWQLAVILVIVILIFGTKKLRNMGGDLGGAFKNFKKAMSDEDSEAKKTDELTDDAKKIDHQEDADFADLSTKKEDKQPEEKQPQDK